jgi:Flp pilus assembly protein, ATPase CpaF
MLPGDTTLSDIAAAVRQNTTDHPDLPVSEAIASQIARAGDIGLFSSAWSGRDDDELSTKIQQHLGGLGPLQHALDDPSVEEI